VDDVMLSHNEANGPETMTTFSLCC